MKILLIDDLASQQTAIRGNLVARYGAGTAVTCVSTGAGGKTAGDAALEPPWDVILIDLSLPEYEGSGTKSGDGLSLAAIFRKDPNYRYAIIIVYSRGWVDKNDPQTKWKLYTLSGIFACETSLGSDMASLIDEHLGEGPWDWQMSSD